MSRIDSNQSPASTAEVLGERLQAARLNANLTQLQIAEKAGISRNTVRNAEAGKAYLETFVAILQALNMADQLDLMLPPVTISPVQLAQFTNKTRQRATGVRSARDDQEVDW